MINLGESSWREIIQRPKNIQEIPKVLECSIRILFFFMIYFNSQADSATKK